ncbi:MAG: DUF3368 domain-containing protein [Acidobacteria bacterium]|nr:DUF3368 domain-containing protein [Acidobacteriota bacterium]
MKIVSDATPLIALSKIGRFDLLRRLFTSLIVTPEVYAEVVFTGEGLPGAQDTSKASWIEVRQISNRADLAAAQAKLALDIGEISALLLAKEINADLVLIDDLRARKIAIASGLKVQGTIGILEACFERGLVGDLRDAYRDLLEMGIYLDRAFLNARLERLKLPPLE